MCPTNIKKIKYDRFAINVYSKIRILYKIQKADLQIWFELKKKFSKFCFSCKAKKKTDAVIFCQIDVNLQHKKKTV